jgi:hypothetical protein
MEWCESCTFEFFNTPSAGDVPKKIRACSTVACIRQGTTPYLFHTQFFHLTGFELQCKQAEHHTTFSVRVLCSMRTQALICLAAAGSAVAFAPPAPLAPASALRQRAAAAAPCRMTLDNNSSGPQRGNISRHAAVAAAMAALVVGSSPVLQLPLQLIQPAIAATATAEAPASNELRSMLGDTQYSGSVNSKESPATKAAAPAAPRRSSWSPPAAVAPKPAEPKAAPAAPAAVPKAVAPAPVATPKAPAPVAAPKVVAPAPAPKVAIPAAPKAAAPAPAAPKPAAVAPKAAAPPAVKPAVKAAAQAIQSKPNAAPSAKAKADAADKAAKQKAAVEAEVAKKAAEQKAAKVAEVAALKVS